MGSPGGLVPGDGHVLVGKDSAAVPGEGELNDGASPALAKVTEISGFLFVPVDVPRAGASALTWGRSSMVTVWVSEVLVLLAASVAVIVKVMAPPAVISAAGWYRCRSYRWLSYWQISPYQR